MPAEFADNAPAAALAADGSLNPLVDPGRVTFAGDWHGSGGFAKYVIRAAKREGSGAVVQLGDFGIWPGASGQRYLDEVSRHASESQMPVLFVDGNHEDFDQLHALPIGVHGLRVVRPWVWHIPRGFRWTWGGLTFLALGGATSLDRPRRTTRVDWWPQEEITWADAHRAVSGGQADVLLTHDCPAGVQVPGLPPDSTWNPAELTRANGHRELLRTVVDEVQPTHLLHGHFHSRYDADLELGSGLTARVTGLDCDGTMSRAYLTVDLDDLYLDSAIRRDT